MRRAEIAISVVVIIALALLALIMLATLLVQSLRDGGSTISECEDTYGGVCTTRTACLNDIGGRVIGTGTCQAQFTQQFDNNWGVQTFPAGGGVCCIS